MRPILTLSLILALFVAHAQWTPLTTGMLSNRSMTSINGDLYDVSYPNGVKKSVGGTGPWTAVNTGLPQSGGNWFVQSIGTDGAYLYAGTESGIYRSTSGTDTWDPINGTLTASTTVYANKFFSIGGSIMAVFAGTIAQGGGIWRSSNFGNSWLIGHSGMGSNAEVYHLTQVGTTIYASTSTGLWTSTDNAQNWTAMANVNYSVFSLTSIGNRLVIVSTFGIRYSTDNGANWFDATGDISNPTKGELVTFDGKLFTLVDQPASCLRSLDNGSTWSDYNTGFGTVDAAAQEAFFAHGNMLYCTALFDIYSITGSGTGVATNFMDHEARVFPTEFSEGFTLRTGTSDGMLELWDASGRMVRTIRATRGSDQWIDRNDLASGIYQAVLVDTRSGASSRLGNLIAR